MSEDSQYFVQSIFGYGAYVYKHNGVNFASAYSITICSDILKGTLSEDILAIGCGSGNVYVYRLDASSSTLIASFTDHTSAITGVTVNMTIGYLVTCAVDYKVFIYEWDGSTFQNFQQVTNTTHAYSVKVFSDSEYVYLLIGWTQSYVDIYYLDQPGGASTFTILQQYYEGLPSATYSVEVSPDLKFMSFSTSDSSAF